MKNLKRIRTWRGLSQGELARLAGVSVFSIKQHEQGISKDTLLSFAILVAKALDVPVQVLYMDLPWNEEVPERVRKAGRPRKTPPPSSG